MPHSRRSVDLDALSSQERAGFLREAEQVRNVAANNGELLAIFRKVPIELVLQIRFVAEKSLLLFTVATTSGLSRTRVHDLAAVGDRESGKVHLVAHRTRYQTAFLR